MTALYRCRSGSLFVSDLRKAGVLPTALANFILMLGWSPTDAKASDCFDSIEEMANAFDLKQINKAPAVVNMDKLHYFNKRVIHAAGPKSEVFRTVVAQLAEKPILSQTSEERREEIVAALKNSFDDVAALSAGIDRIFSRPEAGSVETAAEMRQVLCDIRQDVILLTTEDRFETKAIQSCVKARMKESK